MRQIWNHPLSREILLILLLKIALIFTLWWVFFRAPDFHSAWGMLVSMFSSVPKGAMLLSNLTIIKVAIVIVAMLGFHWLMRNRRILSVADKMPWWLLGLIWAGMLILLILSQESSSSFIYFQF